jgi:hypothetical protein
MCCRWCFADAQHDAPFQEQLVGEQSEQAPFGWGTRPLAAGPVRLAAQFDAHAWHVEFQARSTVAVVVAVTPSVAALEPMDRESSVNAATLAEPVVAHTTAYTIRVGRRRQQR